MTPRFKHKHENCKHCIFLGYYDLGGKISGRCDLYYCHLNGNANPIIIARFSEDLYSSGMADPQSHPALIEAQKRAHNFFLPNGRLWESISLWESIQIVKDVPVNSWDKYDNDTTL